MSEFKVGNVVRLKSGGPKMTIEQYPCYDMGIEYTDKVKCVWFDRNKIFSNIFPIETIELDEGNEPLIL